MPKIVHAEHGGGTKRRQRQPAQEAQQRVTIDPHAELLAQPRPCRAPEGRSDVPQRAGKPLGAPSPGRDDLRQAFGKNPPRTPSVRTEKLPYAQLEPDAEVCPRQIGDRALIATVGASGGTSTPGTVSPGLRGGEAQCQLRCGLVYVPRLQVQRRALGQQGSWQFHLSTI